MLLIFHQKKNFTFSNSPFPFGRGWIHLFLAEETFGKRESKLQCLDLE